MTLISEFINIKGMDIYNKTKEFIEENNLGEKFSKMEYDVNNLFEFAIDYGLYDIVTFLYENKKISFNLNLIKKYHTVIEVNEDNIIKIPIISDYSGNKGIRLKIEDKFSLKRNECINYLIEMRKRSKLYSKNGNFFYKFNK